MSTYPLNAGTCAMCGREIEPQHMRWISDSLFCQECIKEFEQEGQIAQSSNPRIFLLSAKGEQRFPGLKVVAHCCYDSTPIYQRWISAGIAEVGEKPVCPSCLGKTAEMLNCRM